MGSIASAAAETPLPSSARSARFTTFTAWFCVVRASHVPLSVEDRVAVPIHRKPAPLPLAIVILPADAPGVGVTEMQWIDVGHVAGAATPFLFRFAPLHL